MPLRLDNRAPRAAGVAPRYVSAVTAETRDAAQLDAAERAHMRRIIRIAATVFVIEAALVVVAYLGPSMRVLLRPVYVVVALVGVLSIWHTAWRRSRQDRRHTDRRHRS